MFGNQREVLSAQVKESRAPLFAAGIEFLDRDERVISFEGNRAASFLALTSNHIGEEQIIRHRFHILVKNPPRDRAILIISRQK